LDLLGWFALAAGASVTLLAARRWREGLGLAALTHAAFCTSAAIPNHRFSGPIVRRFRPTSREVWLTLDDGPHPDSTPAILDLLRHHNAKATFFVIGTQATKHPELLRAIVTEGHTLGNHTWHHESASFWTAGPARIAREIDGVSNAVVAAGLPPPEYFRPPVGMANIFITPALAAREMRRIGWSARAFDTRPQPPAVAVERIMRTCRPGAIILFHERGPAAGTRGLGPVLERLSSECFRCVIPPNDALIVEGPWS
jgi:peptidoglycan/xylan/chitin deacetylase (PgdA/CDA1 family)